MENEKLVLKLRGFSDNLEKIKEEAGGNLVRNIRSNARTMLGNHNKYPFEVQGNFQRDDTVWHDKAESAVFIKHPAAKRLEYGLGSITIEAKEGSMLKFKGRDGEDVYREKVTISPTKPTPFVRTAISDTQKEMRKRFTEVING